MLPKQLADFLEEGLSIHLATRDGSLTPNAARVTAVRVDPDGQHLEAFVPAVAVSNVLPNLESNGQASLVFVRPSDERGCQVKGVFTGSRVATSDERADVTRQWNQFRTTLVQIGLPYSASDAWPIWPSVAIRLRATALFNQTPGPGAGAPLA